MDNIKSLLNTFFGVALMGSHDAHTAMIIFNSLFDSANAFNILC